jgi:hypothetical protein
MMMAAGLVIALALSATRFQHHSAVAKQSRPQARFVFDEVPGGIDDTQRSRNFGPEENEKRHEGSAP